MNRKKDILVIVLFALLLCIGLVNQYVPIWRFEETSENRNMEKMPVLRPAKLDYFPPAYEKHYRDHFSFREPLLNFYHSFLYYRFKVSPRPEAIVAGKGERLYETEMALRIYSGKENFGPEAVRKVDSTWLLRKRYFDSLGIDFWWTIPPLSHYVYEEELPHIFIPSPTPRRVALLKQDVDSAIGNRMIDLYPVLRPLKDSVRLYFYYDNHWTIPAGFIATQAVLAAIREKYPQVRLLREEDYAWKEQPTGYTNGRDQIGVKSLRENEWVHIHLAEKAMEAEKFDYPLPQGFAYPNSFQQHYKKQKPENGLKALFIIDSFGERQVPFLKEQFDESLFIFDGWEYGVNAHIVETYKPDIIVYVSFEKLMGRFGGMK